MTTLTKDEIIAWARESDLPSSGIKDELMRFAVLCRADLVAENAKLRGLVAGRSAEYLAAHITYDKGYEEGRLDAEAAFEQLLTDPENQPSQFGTVPLAMYDALRAELSALRAGSGEAVAYIRKDQLQKAAQSPLLCEVTPEPRQDRVGIYTHPQPSAVPVVTQLVESLAGYRRELNDGQPCDAEKAGQAWLKENT